MDRAKKESVVEGLGDVFNSSGVVVVAHYEGLTGGNARLSTACRCCGWDCPCRQK